MTGEVGAARRGGSAAVGVLLSYGLLIAAVQVTRPTASYRALELADSAAVVGVVAAAYAGLAAFGALPIGRSVDRWGARPLMIGGATALLAGAALSASAVDVYVLAGAQATLGLGHCACAVSFQTWTGEQAAGRGEAAFARLALAQSAGQLVGPLIAGLTLGGASAPPASATRSTFLVAGVVAAAGGAVLVLGTRRRRTRGPRRGDAGPTPPRGGPGASAAAVAPDDLAEPKVPVGRIVRRPGMPHALVTSIALITAIDLLIAYLPVVGEARGIAPATVGLLLSLRAGAGLVSRLAMPWLLGRFGGGTPLRVSMLVAGGALLGMSVAPNGWAMAPLVVLVGFAIGIGNPVTMAWVAARAPSGGRGTAMALRMTGNRAAQIVVPAGVGVLATTLGAGAALVFAATSLLGGGLWAGRPPEGERDPAQ